MSNEEIHDQAIDLITEYRRRLGAHDSEGVQILDEKVREKFFPSLPLALTQESIRKNMQFDKLLGALVFAGNPVAIKRNVLRITTEQEIRAGNNEEDNWPAIEKIMKREEKEVLANYFSESAEDIALGELFSALIAAKNQKEATEVLKTHLNDNQKINEFFMHFYHEYLRYQSFYGDGKAPEEHILEMMELLNFRFNVVMQKLSEIFPENGALLKTVAEENLKSLNLSEKPEMNEGMLQPKEKEPQIEQNKNPLKMQASYIAPLRQRMLSTLIDEIDDDSISSEDSSRNSVDEEMSMEEDEIDYQIGSKTTAASQKMQAQDNKSTEKTSKSLSMQKLSASEERYGFSLRFGVSTREINQAIQRLNKKIMGYDKESGNVDDENDDLDKMQKYNKKLTRSVNQVAQSMEKKIEKKIHKIHKGKVLREAEISDINTLMDNIQGLLVFEEKTGGEIRLTSRNLLTIVQRLKELQEVFPKNSSVFENAKALEEKLLERVPIVAKDFFMRQAFEKKLKLAGATIGKISDFFEEEISFDQHREKYNEFLKMANEVNAVPPLSVLSKECQAAIAFTVKKPEMNNLAPKNDHEKLLQIEKHTKVLQEYIKYMQEQVTYLLDLKKTTKNNRYGIMATLMQERVTAAGTELLTCLEQKNQMENKIKDLIFSIEEKRTQIKQSKEITKNSSQLLVQKTNADELIEKNQANPAEILVYEKKKDALIKHQGAFLQEECNTPSVLKYPHSLLVRFIPSEENVTPHQSAEIESINRKALEKAVEDFILSNHIKDIDNVSFEGSAPMKAIAEKHARSIIEKQVLQQETKHTQTIPIATPLDKGLKGK